MPDPQQIPNDGWTPIQASSTNDGWTPIQQTANQPSELEARHARSREGTQAQVGTPSNPIGETGLTGIATGIGKEEAKTIAGGESLANKVLPSGEQLPKPDVEPTRGLTEGVGGGIEQLAEFAGGEELLKAVGTMAHIGTHAPEVLKLMEKYPKASKIITGMLSAGAVGGAQGTVKGAAEGKAKEEGVGGTVGGAAGAGIGEGAMEYAKPLARILGIGGLEPAEALTKAGRPYVGEQNWEENLEKAAPRLVEADKATPVKTVGDMADLAHNAANDLRKNEFNPMIAKNAKETIPTTTIRDKVRSAITPQMTQYAPEEAKELEEFANNFSKDMPLDKAEQDLQYFNAKLHSYYKASPVERAAIEKTMGNPTKYEAAADELRDLIYKKLEKLGEPAPKELQEQYGALKQIERVFDKRATVADRQVPINLSQVLTAAGGIGEAGAALATGHPVAAAAGAIPLAVATAAKVRNSPESLIRQGLKGYEQQLNPSATKAAIKALGRRAAGTVAGETGTASGEEAGKVLGGEPSPQTHVFNANLWKQSHPNENLDTAIQEAKNQGFEVIQ